MTATTALPPLSKLSTGEKSSTCHCHPLRPLQAALFLAIFQSALFTLGQDWHRTRVSPNAYQEGRARHSEQSGPIVRSAFCCLHLLSLPAFVLCHARIWTRLIYFKQLATSYINDFCSLSLFPSLCLSLSLCLRLSPFSVLPLLLLSLFCTVIFVLLAASHKSLCKALSSHFVVFHPNLSIMFHSLPFCLFNSKAKSWESFWVSIFRVLCLVNERRTRL